MAPHDTNTPKEARRHAVPLVVIGLCLAVVLIGFVWWLSYTVEESPQTPVVSEPAASTEAGSD